MILEQDLNCSDCEIAISNTARKSGYGSRSISIYIILKQSRSTQILHLDDNELSELIDDLIELSRNLPESIPL